MDATAISNDMVDNGTHSWHICARCISAFANGELRYFGKTGCVFSQPPGGKSTLYKKWEDRGIFKCLRCWELGQDCCAVPAEQSGTFEEINGYLQQILDDAALPAPTLSELEIGGLKQKIADLCKPISKSLSREYIPHAVHLFNHNGTKEKDEDPFSEERPPARSRGTAAVVAKAEAGKRALEQEVVKQVAESSHQPGTPKKQRVGATVVNLAKEKERKIMDLNVRIGKAEADREGLTGKHRSALTKLINKLGKELDAVKKT